MSRRIVGWVAIGLALVLLLAAGAYQVMNARTFQVAGELTARVDTDEKVVALTFDDGPSPRDTEAILGILAEAGVRGTFFINGEPSAAAPASLQAVVAAGHQVGNHTWSHRRLILVDRTTVESEIRETDRVIRDADYPGAILFRPPNGKKLVTLPRYLAETDRHTIMWDVAPEDFSGGSQTPRELADLVVQETRPGSIVLLHPWNGRTGTQEALRLVIAELAAQGYQFLTVDELLQHGANHR